MFSKFHCIASGIAAVLLCGTAVAQQYPAKPVRLVAPYPPGGTSDVLARIVAQKLTDGLGRQVFVENRGGAAGNIGHEHVAKSPADGYTLILHSTSALVTNQFMYKRLGFDPLNDFTLISGIASSGPVLVTHPSVPARTVKELVALAKARPDRMTAGSGGVGTTAHIVCEVFKLETGTRIVHVPYKGGGLAVIDLVAGQIDMSFADMVPSVPQIKAGRLHALAVFTDQRSPALPDVPTIAEAGVKKAFPQTWWALGAPKGTPAPIINRINSELAQMMKMPDVQEKYVGLGVFTMHTTPERMTEIVKENTAQMAQVVKAAGITAE